MASLISAGTTSGTALNMSGDTSGVLQLATNGTTTAVTLDASQNATFAGSVKTNTLTSAASTALTLQSAGTTAVTIDTSQNVGIGTTAPTAKFDVLGSGTTYSYLRNSTTTALTAVDSSVAYFGSGTNSPVVLQVNNGEKMRIDSSGNVGIGTTSPGTKLDVTGAIRSLVSSGNAILYLGNGSTQHSIQNPSGAGSPLTFLNDGTERMRIDSSGNLLVGTTSTDAGIGNTNVGTQIFLGGYLASRNSGTSLFLNRNTSDGATAEFRRQGNQVGSISVTTSATAYNTSSDYRLKENIAPITGALTKVAQLKPVTYKWKIDGSGGEGFIAHELAEVCPQAVHGTKDEVDADGKPVYQGIDTSFLVATLTAAIQELKAINDTQAETINALTARIVAIESRGTV